MENFKNEQFVSFKLCAVLSSMMKCPTISVHPTHYVNNPFVQCIHTVCTTNVLDILVIKCIVTVLQYLCLNNSYFT